MGKLLYRRMWCSSSRSLILALLLFGNNHPTSADQPGVPIGDDYLVQIQVLTRHADRAAQNDPFITKSAEEVFFRGGGELSTEGIRHAKEIGAAYRRAYVTRSKFLDGRFNPREAKFRSSGVDRVLMTSAAFSAGLYRDDESSVMAPVYTVPYAEDNLLAIDYSCLQGWDDVMDNNNITESDNMPNRLLEAMREKQWPCSEPPASQSDTVISEWTNARTKPELTTRQTMCAEDGARKFMYQYISQLSGTGTNDTRALPRIQRSVGHLANETVDVFKAMRECYIGASPIKDCDPFGGIAQFRFSHDVNLITLMDIFSVQLGSNGFFQGNTPAFGASLVAELWVREEEFYVKMFLKNGADAPFKEFKFCDYLTNEYSRVDRYCTLDSMEQAKDIYINTDITLC